MTPTLAWRAVVTVGLLISAGAIGGGCASRRPAMKYQLELRKISVETEPPGATVYQIGLIDGARTLLGTTPIKEQSVAVTKGASFKRISPAEVQRIASQLEMVQVVIEKPGYQVYRGNLATQQGGKVAEHRVELEPAAEKPAAEKPTAAAPPAPTTP